MGEDSVRAKVQEELNSEVKPEKDVITIAVDSTAIKVTNREKDLRQMEEEKMFYQNTCGS